MKILKIILVIVIFDFVASNLLFKKMDFWEYDKLTKPLLESSIKDLSSWFIA